MVEGAVAPRRVWRGEALPEYEKRWLARASVAASLIKPGTDVLDIGCGAMLLHRVLPTGCRRGFDVRPLAPEVERLDLDTGEFPSGRFDYIVMLGVLGWLQDPVAVLRRARTCAPYLIASDRLRRPFPLWVGGKSDELIAMLPGTGWSLSRTVVWRRALRTNFVVCLLE
jgi:hypothetical protein